MYGDALRAGDPIPILQHPSRSLASPRICLAGGFIFLPVALPVDSVQLIHDGFRPQEGFAHPNHLIQIVDPLGNSAYAILRTAGLIADAPQQDLQVLQCFNIIPKAHIFPALSLSSAHVYPPITTRMQCPDPI